MKRSAGLLGVRVLIVSVAVALGAPVGTLAAPGVTPPGPQRFVIVPAESQASYQVAETFLNQGNRLNIAVGSTNAVKGEITIDRARPASTRIGTIVVDISQLKSDSARRDNMIRNNWLESSKFPMAEFVPTEIRGLPETYQDGREITLQVTGNLKIRDVSKPTTFVVSVKLDSTMLTGAATATILMTDFGFDPPSILGILKAENQAKLELRFVARP
jgi:polyisoprenoid-binding protein YceI